MAPVRIAEPICQQTLGLAWNEEHYLPQAALALRQFIIDYYSADALNQKASADSLADD